MFPRHNFALQLILEAQEADRREEERKELMKRRKLLTASRISNTHFIQRYRLTKEGFYFLCNTLRENTNLRSSQRVSLENKVLSALLFYANGDYQRVIGIANSLSQEAISRYIYQVTKALNHPNILKRFIQFPETREAREQLKQKFYDMHHFPGIIGCVDGSHFRIFKPLKQEEHMYFCRKQYHSLNVQMVSDHQGKILALNPRFGGATHDAFVWENSNVNHYMQQLHRNGESVWLLGDSGYPQRPWLMTPYSNPQSGTPAETYNEAHTKTRVVIENTFGRLKNRWRCLCKDRVLHYKPEKCAEIIIACAVLHNIALDFGVPEPENTINDNQFHRLESVPDGDNQSLLTLGRLMRDRIANMIHSNPN